jgi:hypothetical protein
LKAIISIFLLLFISNASGQTIELQGRIVDEKNKGVKDATIKIDEVQGQYFTNKNGLFVINVPPNSIYTLRISYLGKEPFVQTVVVEDKNKNIGTFKMKQTVLGPIQVEYVRPGEFIDRFPPVNLSRIATPSGNFEDLIKVAGLGVSSSSELTANYNVRGGNYDENLIYVNGIEIYRPFLVRSGQQEGLSFINSAFVENISFSAGGFDAYYGDKLSSVLDIQYREPLKFGGSAQASFMGGQAHLEGVFGKKRGNFITGARYRNNGYLINSLPTKGDYNPTFFDYQLLTNYYLNYNNENSYTKLFVLGHYSTNNYRFIPSTRNTTWGTVNEAFQLKVFFEGQEETRFKTFTAATGIEWRKNKQFKMNFVSSVFHSIESEHFDILGEYLINALETDPAKEEFGDSTSNVGIGGFLDHARNDLEVWIGNVYLNGKYDFKSKEKTKSDSLKTTTISEFRWGTKAQYELFFDELSEWHLIDSSGYSIPQGASDEVELKEVIKQDNKVESYRFTGHVQYSHNWIRRKTINVDLDRTIKKANKTKYKISLHQEIKNSPSKLTVTLGTRGGLRTYNDEYWITPRASITYTPRKYFLTEDTTVVRRNMKFRFASGLYYQPPLYRTMRGVLGAINPDVVSQKSWHNVIGADVFFTMWGRPFKFVTEAYYKHMWDVVPYEIDNVRIRYYAENNAKAYAYGIDAKVNGEFVKGVESFFRIGVLKTAEDIENDDYYLYLNSDGDTIVPGFTFNNTPTDSLLQVPGYIPRPSDQRLTMSLFFQDKMPRFENFKVSTNLTIGTPLPYGPPTYERYKDVLRSNTYIRVDLGFMYDIVNPENRKKYQDKKVMKHLDQWTISLDAFNLLGINNIISYQWLQDIAGRYYAIPNHLTGRRVNLRMIIKF